MTAVAVFDLGVGNTASMLFALERLGATPVLTAEPRRLAEAERIVFPGVGSASYAAMRLEALGVVETLRTFDRPLLGVCLGMQMLYASSEEGDAPGLGRLPGQVRRLQPAPDRPVPHMGWNTLSLDREDALTEGLPANPHVYFVHGYAAAPGGETVASADYGGAFSAVVRQGNVCGCQFHPERSGEVGARILRNFLALPC